MYRYGCPVSRSNYHPETLAAVATTSVEVSQVHTAPQSGVDRTEYFNVFQKPTGGFTVYNSHYQLRVVLVVLIPKQRGSCGSITKQILIWLPK